jgi:hypothetical protein
MTPYCNTDITIFIYFRVPLAFLPGFVKVIFTGFRRHTNKEIGGFL